MVVALCVVCEPHVLPLLYTKWPPDLCRCAGLAVVVNPHSICLLLWKRMYKGCYVPRMCRVADTTMEPLQVGSRKQKGSMLLREAMLSPLPCLLFLLYLGLCP